MSHFTVLVPANNREELEAKLLPYHEYECTGIEAYLQFVPGDEEDMQENYKKYGKSLDFDEFIKDEYGYTKNEQGVYGRMTNPNKKWDWWTIGGRWTGALLLKKNQMIISSTENGTPGLMTHKNIDPFRADYGPAGEVDWDGMAAEWRGKQRNWYDKKTMYLNLAKNQTAPEETVVMAAELFNDSSKRSEFAKKTFGNLETAIIYETARKLAEADKEFWFESWDDIAKALLSQDEFEKTLLDVPAQTYAFIDLEGRWNQRGEMGWFGIDDKSEATNDYEKTWWGFVRALPVNQIVYVVDCHI